MAQSLRRWLAPIIGGVLAVITGVIYTSRADPVDWLTYGRLLAMALVPCWFPFLELRGHHLRARGVNVLVTAHVVLAGYGGSVLGWYATLSHFDLWMHGVFGVVATALLEMLLLWWNGKALRPIGFHLLICLSVMGCAAVWEIFEFFCDLLLGMDSQRVAEALARGTSPIADTMTDILITAAGIAVFYVIKGIKKAAHR